VRKLIEQDHLLPVLFSKKYDPQKKAWTDKPPTMGMALDYFTKSVRKITEDKKTGLVSVTVEWRDPQMAANWAAQLVQIANQTVRKQTISEAKQNLEYLKQEMTTATFETVRESILRLTQVNMNQAMLAQVQNDYAYAIIDPPEVAERNKFVKPQRAIELAVGILLGLMIGVGITLFRARRKVILPALQALPAP
jgi:capsular polysaccharide biosynthesis protein